jgi:hypothetical protein
MVCLNHNTFILIGEYLCLSIGDKGWYNHQLHLSDDQDASRKNAFERKWSYSYIV